MASLPKLQNTFSKPVNPVALYNYILINYFISITYLNAAFHPFSHISWLLIM